MITRKPFIVEFTGTPEAGKTTVINILHKELLEMGYKVKVYPESAENAPKIFPKGCIEEKYWINLNTASHILEAQYLSEYDIIFFDRGAFDRIFWTHLYSIYDPEFAKKNYPFNTLFNTYPPDFLISFYVSEEESITRRGGEGRLVTKEFVSNYNRLLQNFINSVQINKFVISTDNKSIKEVVQAVKVAVLENFNRHS